MIPSELQVRGQPHAGLYKAAATSYQCRINKVLRMRLPFYLAALHETAIAETCAIKQKTISVSEKVDSYFWKALLNIFFQDPLGTRFRTQG